MTLTYAAFISYSHSDETVARWLHRRLEAYRTPTPLVGRQGRSGLIRRRLGKVFRDRDEFAAGGDLTAEIQKALRESAALIVLCSPRAASSQYVSAEIRFFQALGRRDAIFPVIVEGTPEQCYPVALAHEPERLAADLRPARDGKDGALLRLLAGLLGIGFDDLAQRERSVQRRRLRLAIGAVAVVGALAVAAGTLGVVAFRNAGVAERRAALMSIDSARRELDEAETDSALLLLLDAARVLRDAPPDGLLIGFQEALARAHGETLVEVGSSAHAYAVGREVYTTSNAGDLRVIAGTGVDREVPLHSKHAIAVLPDSPGGMLVVSQTLSIERHIPGTRPVVIGAFKQIGALRGDRAAISAAAQGLLLWQPADPSPSVAANEGSVVQIFDVAARQLYLIPAPRASAVNVAVLSDGRRVVFDSHGFVSDIDAPVSGATIARIEAVGGHYAGFPSFDVLAATSCLTGAASVSVEQRKALAKALELAEDSWAWSCQALSSHVLIHVERSTSAGIDGQFILVDGDGHDTTLGALSPTDDGPELSWAAMSISHDSEVLVGMAYGRRIQVKTIDHGLVFDRTFTYPIRFASFVSGDELFIQEHDRPHARLVKFAAPTFATRPVDAVSGGYTALHPAACSDRPYSGAGVDGGVLRIESADGERASNVPGTFNVSISSPDAQFRTSLTTHSSGECVAIASGGRYVALEGREGRVQVHDLAEARRGRASQIGEFEASIPNEHTNVWSALFFLGTGPSVITAFGGRPVVRWAYEESTKSWSASEIYRGDLPVRSAEPDATGKRLILREDLGRGNVSARLYSLEARRSWFDLGSEYKWLTAAFNINNEAVFGRNVGGKTAARMIDVSEAVREAMNALSPRCRSFSGNEVRRSRCWPTELGE
jgi:hypothetical protein